MIFREVCQDESVPRFDVEKAWLDRDLFAIQELMPCSTGDKTKGVHNHGCNITRCEAWKQKSWHA